VLLSGESRDHYWRHAIKRANHTNVYVKVGLCVKQDKESKEEKQPLSPSPPMTKSSVVVAAKHQISCDVSGEAVILNLKSGVYYGLDALGARIWDLIQKPMTVGEIHSILLKEYEVQPDRCERDLLALLQKLADAGLIAKQAS